MPSDAERVSAQMPVVGHVNATSCNSGMRFRRNVEARSNFSDEANSRQDLQWILAVSC
jgi:hypothetical protein